MSVLLPIFMYHQVAPASTPGFDPYLFVRPETLRQQVESLQSRGFSFLTLAEAWPLIEKGAGGARAAVLTFDDLGAHFAEHAWPLLRAAGVRATGFPATAALAGRAAENLPGHPPALPARALRELASQGLEIGSHTVTHRVLTGLATSQVAAELKDSRAALEDITGQACTSLCHPRGRFSRRTLSLAREAGYDCACSTLRGCAHARVDQYRLKRIRAHGDRIGLRLWYATTRLFDWRNRGRAHSDQARFQAEDRIQEPA